MNVLMNEWINELRNEWVNDQEEGKATNKETRGIVCVVCGMYVRDGWDGSEWVRGIEEEEKEKEEAELAEVLLIDWLCYLLLLKKK